MYTNADDANSIVDKRSNIEEEPNFGDKIQCKNIMPCNAAMNLWSIMIKDYFRRFDI